MEGAAPSGKQADIPIRAALDSTHPTFYTYGFARAVHFAVVEDIISNLCRFIPLPPSIPTALGPVVFVAVFGHECYIIAVTGDEQLGAARGKLQ